MTRFICASVVAVLMTAFCVGTVTSSWLVAGSGGCAAAAFIAAFVWPKERRTNQ